jgi:hypothetical protein
MLYVQNMFVKICQHQMTNNGERTFGKRRKVNHQISKHRGPIEIGATEQCHSSTQNGTCGIGFLSYLSDIMLHSYAIILFMIWIWRLEIETSEISESNMRYSRQ